MPPKDSFEALAAQVGIIKRNSLGVSMAKVSLADRFKKFGKALFGKGRWVALIFLIAFISVRVVDPYPVEFMRLKLFDVYQKLKPRQVSIRPVAILDLDEQSLAEIGQWPWPRTIIADMVKNLMDMGAILVAFDIVFAEPDRMNPESVADSIASLDDDMRGILRKLPSNDTYFAETIKKSRVVLGQASYWENIEKDQATPIRSPIFVRGPKGVSPLSFVPPVPSIVRNVNELELAAHGHGFFSLLPEPDGVVRRVPTLFSSNKRLYAGLALEMLRVATGRRNVAVFVDELGIQQIKVAKGISIPTDGRGRVWPYFSKSDKEKYISAVDVLSGVADPAKVKGKMVIVGTSAAGLLDIRSTPVDAIIPGVEVHAQLVESVLKGEYLKRPAHMIGAEVSLLFFGGLLMIWLVPVVGAKWTLMLFTAIAGGAGASSWYYFTNDLILFDVGFAIAAMLLLYTFLVYYGYTSEEKQRQQVRGAFSQYLSPALVEQLADDPTRLKLGGEMRDMTLLFCDVRGFTTISEAFGDDAEGLTALINTFLTPMTDEILSRQGTIDKYMGDCIMAFWNAPLDDLQHAKNGCISAMAMMHACISLNERLEVEAKEAGRKHVPIRVGIGLNSGECCVGNMGSSQRFDYSVLGDNVNLAARLEGQSKSYGVDIVIGENTEKDVRDLACLELDLLKVKGKTEAVRIFTLQGDDVMKQSDEFKALEKRHDEMMTAFRSQQWDEARAIIAECRDLSDKTPKAKMHGFYDIYLGRIEDYEANPPGEDWDGVFVATTK